MQVGPPQPTMSGRPFLLRTLLDGFLERDASKHLARLTEAILLAARRKNTIVRCFVLGVFPLLRLRCVKLRVPLEAHSPWLRQSLRCLMLLRRHNAVHDTIVLVKPLIDSVRQLIHLFNLQIKAKNKMGTYLEALVICFQSPCFVRIDSLICVYVAHV